MAGRRQAFRNNPELQRFVLPGVLPTGRQLGVGSYGSVEELEVNGLMCAGKRLHEVLLEQGNAGADDIARKYLLECQVMTEMRHPHIVQFLGLCFLEGSALPVLVIERMDSSLDELLETSPSLPLSLKVSLLTDVARGLLYLHTRNPSVVHRDLSAKNVLLTSSLVAKISDLGNARIVNLQPGQLALTRVPGTLAYMPPESFDEGSQYGPQLDIFSFGHLALFTIIQVFPGALLPHTYPDPDNPGRLLGRSEVERRRDYIQPLREQLGEQHPLLHLVCQCLHNTPAQRPSAEELLQQLEIVRPYNMGTYGSHHVKVEMARLRAVMLSVLRTKETEVKEKGGEIENLQHELQQVQEAKEKLQVEVEAQFQQKDTQLQQKDSELQQKDTQLQQLRAELRERAAEIKWQKRELQALREDRGRLQAEVEAKASEIDKQQRELQTVKSQNSFQVEQLTAVQSQLQQLKVEMDTRSAQAQQQLQERDAEINRLLKNQDQTVPRDEKVAAMCSPSQKPKMSPLSELTWRKLEEMPVALSWPQAIVIHKDVYFRGYSRVVLKYDSQTQHWIELPQYQYYNFTMTKVNHQLALVGGWHWTMAYDRYFRKTSNVVAVYSTSQGWTQPYPPMNTLREYPAVCTYYQYLVVAGGYDGVNLATVEILDMSANCCEWLFATPLPVYCHRMTSIIIEGELYLLGGTLNKQVLSISLSALTQAGKAPAQWCALSNAPLENSAAIAVCGSLLAVGGNHDKQSSSAIHIYQKNKNAWTKVGDLPTVREHCSCCLLPSGEMLVAGGKAHNDWTSQLDVATVTELVKKKS